MQAVAGTSGASSSASSVPGTSSDAYALSAAPDQLMSNLAVKKPHITKAQMKGNVPTLYSLSTQPLPRSPPQRELLLINSRNRIVSGEARGFAPAKSREFKRFGRKLIRGTRREQLD